ncbi:HNH endonuclease [Bordetella petrii]|uniref:HNH endonuclease n=1 Tax=Bordetella petrii TaxID=94624 RepID=UPI0037306C6C
MSELTAERLRELLAYDRETGIFTNLICRGPNSPKGAVSGYRTDEGYWSIGIGGKYYKAHRLAWLYMTGEWPKGQIDHRDWNKSNNRWRNLREASHSGNMQNLSGPQRNNRSGHLGASYHARSGRFQAQIGVNGRPKYLGLFDTAEEAEAAYLKAKRAFHPNSTLAAAVAG